MEYYITKNMRKKIPVSFSVLSSSVTNEHKRNLSHKPSISLTNICDIC